MACPRLLIATISNAINTLVAGSSSCSLNGEGVIYGWVVQDNAIYFAKKTQDTFISPPTPPSLRMNLQLVLELVSEVLHL